MADFISPYGRYESALLKKRADAENARAADSSSELQMVPNETQIYQIQHSDGPDTDLIILCGVLFFGLLWHWLWQLARDKS